MDVRSRSMVSLSNLNLVDLGGVHDLLEDDFSLVVLDLALAEATHSGETGSEFFLNLVEMDESLGELSTFDLGHMSDTDALLSEAVDLSSAVFKLRGKVFALVSPFNDDNIVTGELAF